MPIAVILKTLGLRPFVLYNGGMIVRVESRSNRIRICLNATLPVTFSHRLALQGEGLVINPLRQVVT